MNKWNLLIDVAKCENCNNCVLATKDEHCDNEFPGYAAAQPKHGQEWISIKRRVRGVAPMVDVAYLPTTCNHCDRPACIKAGNDGAVVKREDGIVIIDPKKAVGRKDLVDACPYGAIWWNEERQLPQKWIFDAHLIDAGMGVPRCVQACPTGAMEVLKVSDEEMARIANQQQLEVLQPRLDARPRVYYRNLSRFTKCFLGGTVVAKVNGLSECVATARVVLRKNEQVVATKTTDAFGDFKFDGLEPNSGRFSVEIIHPRLGRAFVWADVEESQYLGRVLLESQSKVAVACNT